MIATSKLSPGYMFDDFQKTLYVSRGKGSSSRVVSNLDNASGIIMAPGRSNQRIQDGLEDTRPSINSDLLGAMTTEAHDELDEDMDELVAGSAAPSSEDDGDDNLHSSTISPAADLHYDGSGINFSQIHVPVVGRPCCHLLSSGYHILSGRCQ